MYTPKFNQVADRVLLIEAMRAYSFAILIGPQSDPASDASPVATHLPLVVRDEGEHGLLEGHFARANPHWKSLGRIHPIRDRIVGKAQNGRVQIIIATEVGAPEHVAVGVRFYNERVSNAEAEPVGAGDVNIAGRIERDGDGVDIAGRCAVELAPKQLAGGADLRKVASIPGHRGGLGGPELVPRVNGMPGDIEVAGGVYRAGRQVGFGVYVATKKGVPLVGGKGRRGAACHG